MGTTTSRTIGRALAVVAVATGLLTAPGAPTASNPPDSNDWRCEPTAAHPRPVVLVHGFASVANDTWQTYSPTLANEGNCVFAVNYGVPAGTPFPLDQIGGRTPLETNAAQLAGFVDRVRAATDAAEVDITACRQLSSAHPRPVPCVHVPPFLG